MINTTHTLLRLIGPTHSYHSMWCVSSSALNVPTTMWVKIDNHYCLEWTHTETIIDKATLPVGEFKSLSYPGNNMPTTTLQIYKVKVPKYSCCGNCCSCVNFSTFVGWRKKSSLNAVNRFFSIAEQTHLQLMWMCNLMLRVTSIHQYINCTEVFTISLVLPGIPAPPTHSNVLSYILSSCLFQDSEP